MWCEVSGQDDFMQMLGLKCDPDQQVVFVGMVMY